MYNINICINLIYINMFIIWYTLFSILYLFISILHFFFCKIFKCNDLIFNIIFSKINHFFNFYNSINNITKSDLNINFKSNNFEFKNLYKEYQFFSNKNITINLYKNVFNNVLSYCLLNNLIFRNTLNYSSDMNFLSYSLINKSNNSKKINLSFFSNKLFILNSQINNINIIVNNKKEYIKTKKKNFIKFVSPILILENLNNKINNSWIIKFSPSNFIKYINYLNINTYNILYLRKAKVFNKGRYSRNRQYYRTGVYWCLYVNIIAVVGIYFWFYRFTMNFGYLWWLLYAFIVSFIVPKAIKYKLYNPNNLLNSILNDFLWLGSLLFSINNFFKNILNNFQNFINNYFISSQFFNLKSFTSIYFSFLKLLNINNNKNILNNNIYAWEFNNTNYYYNSIIQSRPIILEKIKHFVLRLINIIFLNK